MILLNGELEIIKQVDQNEMVIDKLSAGASLNSKGIMMPGYLAKVDIRCKTKAMLLILNVD